MQAKDLLMEDIAVGDTFSFEHTWTEAEVFSFARLSGDENPLHVDEEYALGTSFKKRLVHGMLLGSLCSRFVGMHIPGKRCLYLSQSLVFRKPVFIGDTTVFTGVVTSKSGSTRILTISTTLTRDKEEVFSGEAKVQVL